MIYYGLWFMVYDLWIKWSNCSGSMWIIKTGWARVIIEWSIYGPVFTGYYYQVWLGVTTATDFHLLAIYFAAFTPRKIIMTAVREGVVSLHFISHASIGGLTPWYMCSICPCHFSFSMRTRMTIGHGDAIPSLLSLGILFPRPHQTGNVSLSVAMDFSIQRACSVYHDHPALRT